MKNKIFIALACAAITLSASTIGNLATHHIEAMRKDGSLNEVIATLIKEGAVCEASGGHRWASGCGMVGCLVLHEGPLRHCSVCKKTQSAHWVSDGFTPAFPGYYITTNIAWGLATNFPAQ